MLSEGATAAPCMVSLRPGLEIELRKNPLVSLHHQGVARRHKEGAADIRPRPSLVRSSTGGWGDGNDRTYQANPALLNGSLSEAVFVPSAP